MTANVLIIDDEIDTGQLVKYILTPLDVLSFHALNGQEGLKMAYELQPDLIILDVMMPGLDGFEVCSRLREFSDVPILMLTAKTQCSDVKRGFAVGADNYVKKPFSNEELLARIDYLLNRNKNHDAKTQSTNIKEYKDGALKVNFVAKQVFLHDQEVCLTSTEYKLLEFLTKHPHKTLTTRTLLTEVWGDAYSHDKTLLSFYIHQLRKKLKEGGGGKSNIFKHNGGKDTRLTLYHLPKRLQLKPRTLSKRKNQKKSFHPLYTNGLGCLWPVWSFS